jgi:hypothetical protein
MTFGLLYILDGAGRPLPCPDIEKWAKWSRAHDRTLALNEAGETIVRTTFLGIDVQVLDDGPPVLFNSEVFLAMDHRKHEHHLASRFYETAEQATRGHLQLCEAFESVAGVIMGDKHGRIDSSSS